VVELRERRRCCGGMVTQRARVEAGRGRRARARWGAGGGSCWARERACLGGGEVSSGQAAASFGCGREMAGGWRRGLLCQRLARRGGGEMVEVEREVWAGGAAW
jgi:hypothetical protein